MNKRGPSKQKPWTPLVRSSEIEQALYRAEAQAKFPGVDLDGLLCDETWSNDRYTVSVNYLGRDRFGAVSIGVHNNARTIHVPWRHLQQIKNEVVGPEREAVQLHPAESRLMDTANEFWLWVYPAGDAPMWKATGRKSVVGYTNGRTVDYRFVGPNCSGQPRQSPPMTVMENGVDFVPNQPKVASR